MQITIEKNRITGLSFGMTRIPPTRYSDYCPAKHQAINPKQTLNPTLIVPDGSPLQPGALYVHLYHGRKSPDEQLDDWGLDGPTFGPLDSVHQTYASTFQMHGKDDKEGWLDFHDDLIIYEGVYYGDISVWIAGEGETAQIWREQQAAT